MSLYGVDFQSFTSDCMPPNKRLDNMLALEKSFIQPMQDNNDSFNEYLFSSLAPIYNNASTYNKFDKVRYGLSVYQCIVTTSTGINPSNNTNWVKLQSVFIGYFERASYTGQKLFLEYALNRYFGVSSFSTVQWDDGVATAPPYTQIYITNNNSPTNQFWLSNGNGLNSYMGNTIQYQAFFLGNTYITNQYNFTIHIPTAVYTAIGAAQPSGMTANDAITAIVNLYKEIDKTFNIVTY